MHAYHFSYFVIKWDIFANVRIKSICEMQSRAWLSLMRNYIAQKSLLTHLKCINKRTLVNRIDIGNNFSSFRAPEDSFPGLDAFLDSNAGRTLRRSDLYRGTASSVVDALPHRTFSAAS